ncbi:hypothetical protein HYPSUDRAFT_205754 [Hypholoma sublateritium FD-334 SS-4]|uniref:Uncharacterized protein n=1 Tax=Hypholoma sublateritium (strain FD-334 SS-4) TaxID=945553 RepID=A0A0D2KTS3_HYPSF|nr:hypothetical protein HYPSUDRAFT_205754 [Hypholoma sublateritium FD-334 SS-4]
MTNAQIKEQLTLAVKEALSAKLYRGYACALRETWKNQGLLEYLNAAVARMGIQAELERQESPRKFVLYKDLANLRSLLLKRQSTSSNRTYLYIANNATDTIISNLIQQIFDQFPELDACDHFFLDIDRPTFTGTLHCEAYLASLLENYTKSGTNIGGLVSQDLLDELKGYSRVIGVSKRCCPACYYFLDLLIAKTTNADKDKFLVRGRHPNITGCSLPPWTPPNIVKDMNLAFGAQLRLDLIELLSTDDENFVRPRSSSAASQSLSVDSNEGPAGSLKFFTAPAMTKRLEH